MSSYDPQNPQQSQWGQQPQQPPAQQPSYQQDQYQQEQYGGQQYYQQPQHAAPGGYSTPSTPRAPIPWLPLGLGALAFIAYESLSAFITTIFYRVGSEYSGWNFESIIGLFADLVIIVGAVLAIITLFGNNKGLRIAAAATLAFATLLQFVTMITRFVNWINHSSNYGGAGITIGNLVSILFGFGGVLILGAIAALLFLKKD